MNSCARERFTELVRSPSRIRNLAEAALLVAAEEKPDVDVDRNLALLGLLAEEARPHVGCSDSELGRIEPRLRTARPIERGAALWLASFCHLDFSISESRADSGSNGRIITDSLVRVKLYYQLTLLR